MFAPGDLLALAKARFGAGQLQARMRGAAGDATKADLELYRIAAGVIARAQDAAAPSVGWPLPGFWPPGSKDDDGTTSIAGAPYSDKWPKNLLQNALDLFNWRTLAGYDQASSNQRMVGQMAEKYFSDVENGVLGLGLSVTTEPGPSEPIAARNRDGTSNLKEVSDRQSILDDFRNRAWDGA